LGDFVKIDKFDWFVKIVSIILLFYFAFQTFTLFALFKGYQIYIIIVAYSLAFTFSVLFYFFAFYNDFRNFYFEIRTKYGELRTERKKFDENFKNLGGIIGYKAFKEDHVAIIWPSESNKNFPSLKNDGFPLLIEHYKKKEIKHIVYFCYLCDDFIKIIKSKYVNGVHIFGHGRISALHFEDGILQYRELKDSDPKEFIAQWHCNHGEGKPLGEYIGKKYYSPYGKRSSFSNERDIKKLINGNLEWTINDKFSI
jgi:hypothetical protein